MQFMLLIQLYVFISSFFEGSGRRKVEHGVVMMGGRYIHPFLNLKTLVLQYCRFIFSIKIMGLGVIYSIRVDMALWSKSLLQYTNPGVKVTWCGHAQTRSSIFLPLPLWVCPSSPGCPSASSPLSLCPLCCSARLCPPPSCPSPSPSGPAERLWVELSEKPPSDCDSPADSGEWTGTVRKADICCCLLLMQGLGCVELEQLAIHSLELKCLVLFDWKSKTKII